MKIEVLGTGCGKCAKLYDATKEAITRAGVDAELVKIEDIAQIMKYRVMVTPALVVDGKVVIAGKVATSEEIVKLLV